VFAQFYTGSREVPGLASHNDGNNVSIDRESKLLAENDIRFNLATQLLEQRSREFDPQLRKGELRESFLAPSRSAHPAWSSEDSGGTHNGEPRKRGYDSDDPEGAALPA